MCIRNVTSCFCHLNLNWCNQFFLEGEAQKPDLYLTMAGKKYIDLKENDFVEYFLFPNLDLLSSNTKSNLELIDEVKENICRVAKKLSENYIWHNEEFQISPRNLVSYEYSDSGVSGSEAFSFYGSLNYGENIEDEWFLVYILMELTKEIKDLVVRVKDTDGEFLLIEAADHLPEWVTPETCEDRVFIFNGDFQILPQSFSLKSEEYSVTEEVINFVRCSSQETRVQPEIQKAIEKRVSGYPGKIEQNFHKVNLYVPVGVAALLNAKPSVIAPAVRAFYERDLLDIKACQAMRFFPPENRVLSQVKFTRCLYAMLATSKYVPDQKTGWNLPHPNDDSYKSHLLGVKVACGFEILVSQVRGRHTADEEMDEVDFSNDLNWRKFLKSLSNRNYFRGLLEHSKEYNRLLETAKDFYRKSCEHSVKPNKAKEISELLDKLEIDFDELKRKEKNLPKSDDDDWMNITQEDLDAMLEARFGRTSQISGDVINGNPDIADHLKMFINHMSGIEGAEIPKGDKTKKSPERVKKGKKNKKAKTVKFSPDTKLHSSTSDEKISNVKPSDKIQFDPDGFINAIQNILDFSIPDDNYWESDGSGMSSYEDETDMELGESTKPATSKDKKLLKYMRQMDEELSNTTMAESFVTKDSCVDGDVDENFDDVESFKPVDIDKNAFKNILSSYQAQMGNAGPAENILGSLGINLSDIDADVD